MASSAVWIDIFQGENGKWYFHAVARNGRIVDSSQGYTRKWSAVRAAKRLYSTEIGFRFK